MTRGGGDRAREQENDERSYVYFTLYSADNDTRYTCTVLEREKTKYTTLTRIEKKRRCTKTGYTCRYLGNKKRARV